MDDQGVKFVVLTTQRSGSTWVMSVLRGLPGIEGHGELFLSRQRSRTRGWDPGSPYPRFAEWSKGWVRPFSVFSYLGTLYSSGGTVGFKLMYSHLRQYPEVAPYLMGHGVSVIHLVRRNLLDILISQAMLIELGRAHLRPGEKAPEGLRVSLDTDQLIRRLRREKRKQAVARRFLSLARLRHVEVVYEDLLRDEAGFGLLWQFLGGSADWRMPPASVARIRTGAQRDALANYREVKAALLGTEFAPLLE